MGIGIVLCIAAGAIWTLGGIMNSRCANQHFDIVTYLFSNVLFSLLLSGIFFVHFGAFCTTETLLLASVMVPAGMLNTAGALALQKAFTCGHHGIAFLISQSALVFPCLAACRSEIFGLGKSMSIPIGA